MNFDIEFLNIEDYSESFDGYSQFILGILGQLPIAHFDSLKNQIRVLLNGKIDISIYSFAISHEVLHKVLWGLFGIGTDLDNVSKFIEDYLFSEVDQIIDNSSHLKTRRVL